MHPGTNPETEEFKAHISRVPEGEEKENGAKQVFEVIMIENSSNFAKDKSTLSAK